MFPAKVKPSSVTFDYTDFSFPVTIELEAIDDLIQENHPHHDTIVATVRSRDSVDECLAAEVARVCNQAVSYDRFADTPHVNVSVRDDDYAGLAISRTEIFPTYDNYGDPLMVASYNISLQSRPSKDVIVSLLASSEYLMTDVSSIVFEPEDWSRSVVVHVSANAPTTDRPACPSGTRYCELLGFTDDELINSEEVISHYVTSDDPFGA